ncbi:MAG: DUF1844 domain-containing protein [Planctomycetes bacterium]|nr:DUF1844 domain-containing protein [Planctomycetota bacterium]
MAEEEKTEDKKIIVDEDWKQQAQKEKEVLAAQEKTEEKTQEAKPEHRALPPGDLAALISMLVTQALFALGMINVEGQEAKEPDLAIAKYNIDMLETLQTKTKGNLTEEEDKVLEDTLNQIRMAYVKLAG